MKLNNDIVVFDLEATARIDTPEHGPPIQTNNDIIEIGAAFLDHSLTLVDTFSHLVRPEEPISSFITELTGLTPEMCATQPLWKDVAPAFEAWVARWCTNIKTVRLCAWGTYFDVPLLRRSYQRYGLPFPFSGTCFDAKTIAMLWCSLSGRRTDELSVKRVARYMGIAPEGDYHRALTDAVTEAKIVQRVFADLDSGVFVQGTSGQLYLHLKIMSG